MTFSPNKLEKIGFIFSGQGAQYVGMGKELYENYDVCKKTFLDANEALGFEIDKICFEQNPKLDQTEYTQPAILTTSISIFNLLSSFSIKACSLAGLSLGEYSALVAGKYLNFKEAVRLVKKRGKLMQEANISGGMAAIFGLDKDIIINICNKTQNLGLCTPANFNTPSQIVISGEFEALDEAIKLCKQAGAKKTVKLNVSGPFHSILLKDAAEKLKIELEKLTIQDPDLPVISNVDAREISKNDLVDTLHKQIVSPVLWEDSINYMISSDILTFVELGPSKILSSFVKSINKNVNVFNIENIQSLNNFISYLKS